MTTGPGGSSTRAREREEGIGVVIGGAEVRLQHDSRPRPAAEALAAREGAGEDLPGEVPERELLHVDRDADAGTLRGLRDRLERRASARDRALRIDGAEVRGERGELERDLEREGPARGHLSAAGSATRRPIARGSARGRTRPRAAEPASPRRSNEGRRPWSSSHRVAIDHGVGARGRDEAPREELGGAPEDLAEGPPGTCSCGRAQQPAQSAGSPGKSRPKYSAASPLVSEPPLSWSSEAARRGSEAGAAEPLRRWRHAQQPSWRRSADPPVAAASARAPAQFLRSLSTRPRLIDRLRPTPLRAGESRAYARPASPDRTAKARLS